MAVPLIQRLRRSIWTLPLAAIAALVLLVINEAAYDRSTSALLNLGERGNARMQVQQLSQALAEAEAGQRGFLLTAQDGHLQSYRQAITQVDAALRWLATYYGQDAQAAPLLRQVSERSRARLSALAVMLQLHAQGRPGQWRVLLNADARAQTSALREGSQQLLALETARIVAERRDVFDTLRMARIGVTATTLLSLLGLFFFIRQTLAIDAVQQRHAEAMRLERDQLEREVARRTADLTDLARHLQTAREDERSLLARELHDELGALLTAAKLDAARLKRALGPLQPDVQTRLEHLNEAINQGISLKRRIIEDLRPSTLSNFGLETALEILARDFATRSELRVHTQLSSPVLSDSAQTTVYRLVQESFTNIAKHAGATEVQVTLQPEPRNGQAGVLLAVRDNGRGFDPAERKGSAHGLLGMHYRVEAEGGQLQVQASPGQGALLEAWLPTLPAAPAGQQAEGPDQQQAPAPEPRPTQAVESVSSP